MLADMNEKIELINRIIADEKRLYNLDMGGISDTYHTFDELYNHRMILFITILSQNKHLSWKSRLHYDGTMYDDFFIAGITTRYGQFTYHFHEKYWNWFSVGERERAPEFDGHTSDDVMRLLSLDTKSYKSSEEIAFVNMERNLKKLENKEITEAVFLNRVKSSIKRANKKE